MPYGEEAVTPEVVTEEAPVKVDWKKAIQGNLADEHKKRLGTLLELTPDQKARLKKFLKNNLEAWIQDTSELHERLRENDDLVEGVVEETDYPFEGASNIHVPITAIYMKLFHSVQRRSILGADLIWYAEADPGADDLADSFAEVEEMVNSKARSDWNIPQALSDVFWTTDRDSLGVLKVPFAEEYETTTDILLITNALEFMEQFPTPEDAGMDEKAYMALLAKIEQEATEETPIEIPVTFEKLVYSGPKAQVVDLVNFVTFPATTQDIRSDSCRGYGDRFCLRRGAVKKKKRDKVWYPDAVSAVLKKRKQYEPTEFQRAQDEREGLTRTDPDEFEFYELAVKFELDRGKPERKILVTYSLDCDYLMACMDYPYRVDFYALFRIGRRPNRLLGESVPDQTRDMNEEIDTQHNQRIISRQISTVPSFKARKGADPDFDPDAEEYRWKPGVIFWLTDPDAFEQFKVQPVDLGESMQEEKNDMSILDLLLGSSAALLSGQASPSDPSAPGNKTAMMITQSNLRMDDPLSELRFGVDQLGDICVSHLYQFGPIMIDYVVEDDQGQKMTRSLHKKVLRSGLKMRMAGVTVVGNPDTEMQKWLTLLGQMMQMEPMLVQDANIRMEWLRTALRAGRVPNRQKLLPSPEQIMEMQVQVQMEAQRRLMLEQAQAEMANAEAANKERMAGAQNEMKRKQMAEKMATQGLGFQANGNGKSNAS